MKIEILEWKNHTIEAVLIEEQTLEEVAESHPFDDYIGMIIDGHYGVAYFDFDTQKAEFTKTSKEEAEKYALA